MRGPVSKGFREDLGREIELEVRKGKEEDVDEGVEEEGKDGE